MVEIQIHPARGWGEKPTLGKKKKNLPLKTAKQGQKIKKERN